MMHPRKEKSDRASLSNQDAVLTVLPLLESSDYESESIKNLIYEHLCGTRDSRIVYGIVDYYITAQSQRSLEILLHLKEPHDKHLFDKINELMKIEKYRYNSLQLLCNLVYKQPTFLYKIATHRVMYTLLHLLKNDENAPNLMSGIFILICLLPMIPSQFGAYLQDTFDIFSRLAQWKVKRPSFIVDVYMVHLEIVIYSLFHRLYGMFPCNFLAYLRSYYGGRDYKENFKVFTLVIKPMLERVRLHPLLVTASKETELSANRWKKMAYHDIVIECASISLDAIEGTYETMRRKNNVPTLINEQNFSSLESAQFISTSSHSSTSVNFESDSVVNEAVSSQHEAMWSPSHAPALIACSTTTASQLPIKGEQESRTYNMKLSTEEVPLDFAIEAKPEILRTESDCANAPAITPKDMKAVVEDSMQMKDSGELNTSENKNAESTERILRAVEAKEDDVDKEVSELTCSQNVPTRALIADVRHDTPFCSTTQNLTDEPGDLPLTMSNSGRSDSLTKSNDEAEEMFSSMQDGDGEAFVPSFNRYRYFSHCGPPPEIPIEPVKKTKVFRSSSCPAKLYPADRKTMTCVSSSEETGTASESTVVTCCSSTLTTSNAFVTVVAESSGVSSERHASYQELIPVALGPLSDTRRHGTANFVAPFSSPHLILSTLSPPEVLDRYIQSGNITCQNQLNAIPITSTTNTDWTHFGGKPPPDEITILRNQILLLHIQMLFERHRKDVHNERNRRILGIAKRFRMQEEHIVALKEQIKLLEQDKYGLKNLLEKKTKLHHQLQLEKQKIESDLLSKISKIEKDNAQFLFSNKNLQNLLVSQKQENDEIRELCKKSLSDVRNLKFELECASREALRCQKLEKNSIYLSKQLILLQELVNHYKDKVEHLKEAQEPNIGADILNETALNEIKDLKQKLDAKGFLFDASKTKVSQLEQVLQNLKIKQKEQMQALEKMKSLHKDEIMVLQERLKDLKKISIQKDAHILNLYKEMESLSEGKRILANEMHSKRISMDETTCQLSIKNRNDPPCNTEMDSKCQRDTDI